MLCISISNQNWIENGTMYKPQGNFHFYCLWPQFFVHPCQLHCKLSLEVKTVKQVILYNSEKSLCILPLLSLKHIPPYSLPALYINSWKGHGLFSFEIRTLAGQVRLLKSKQTFQRYIAQYSLQLRGGRTSYSVLQLVIMCCNLSWSKNVLIGDRSATFKGEKCINACAVHKVLMLQTWGRL
jgi:hypothetical protein